MTRRRLGTAVAGVLVVMMTAALVAPVSPATAVARRHAVMGPQVLRPGQMARWYRRTGLRPARGVRVGRLARLFLQEGRAEGVRGDIAFAQAVVETGYFRFGGDVRPGAHNYAGLGAVGGGARGARFRTARLGVRAQIQHLRAYADPRARPGRLAHRLVDPRFGLVRPKGKARRWVKFGSGVWAADPTGYGRRILRIYRRMAASRARR
ncbi:MAG: glucosaminidase domain-containing protein [Actinobacteria bacterium]|nr:glucosaminidase domain-containing protein [Actinomycetota bacterium]